MSIKDCALYVVRSVTLFPLFSPVNRLPAKAGRFAILDILSFFALTSLRSVPAIMVAGICTKRTTSSILIGVIGMKDFGNWLYSQLVVAAFAFVLLVVPSLIERML